MYMHMIIVYQPSMQLTVLALLTMITERSKVTLARSKVTAVYKGQSPKSVINLKR